MPSRSIHASCVPSRSCSRRWQPPRARCSWRHLLATPTLRLRRLPLTLASRHDNRITERASDSGGTLVRNIQRTIDALDRVQQTVGAN